jgi:AmiR/NasT family two-component response regulator
MAIGIKRLFDELRGISVAVIHPPGADCNVLLDQLRRIGCPVQSLWPYPPAPPSETDVVFVLVPTERGSEPLWSGVDSDAVVIALVEYENPTVLKGILDLNAQAVINKPFRPTGVLSTLILARSTKGYQDRLLSKVKKLEETLRSRREIERAVKLLAERQGVTDIQAYEQIRRQATTKRIAILEVCSAINSAGSVLDGLWPLDR